MGCGCGSTTKSPGSRDAVGETLQLLDQAGLRGHAEQVLLVRDVAAASVDALNKADKAAGLGFGDEVVRMYRSAGERDNRQARKQYRHLLERIDARTTADDWQELVTRSREGFEQRDGRETLDDTRDRIRQFLLDDPNVPPQETDEIMSVADDALGRLASGGLEGAVRFMRDQVELGLRGLEHPEMGRQPASPQSDTRLRCYGLALAIAIAAFAVCFAIPLCWCCATPIILGFLAIALLVCAAANFA
jgi:hypothetical protein